MKTESREYKRDATPPVKKTNWLVLALITSIVILVCSFFALANSTYKEKVAYKIVAADSGTQIETSGKRAYANMKWVWSLQNKEGIKSDKYVSFSDFSSFKVGDRVSFQETFAKSWERWAVLSMVLSFFSVFAFGLISLAFVLE